MIRILIISGLCCLLSSLAVSQEISGHWRGTLTQYSASGLIEYEFSLSLYEENGKITGESYVAVQDFYAIESLSGEYNDNVLTFQEKEIVRQKRISENVFWCIKNGSLTLHVEEDGLSLKGWWAGFIYNSLLPEGITKCDDGYVILKKETERAQLELDSNIEVRLKK